MSKIANEEVLIAKKKAEEAKIFYTQEDYDDLLAKLAALKGSLMGYAMQYATDRTHWLVTKRDIEKWFSVDMGSFDFRGKIDLLPHVSKSEVILVDHKMMSNVNEAFIDKLPLDSQMRGYIFGALYGLRIKISRIVYNVVKKCKLRQKGGETTQGFCSRICKDYYDVRPDFYFHRETLRFSTSDIAAFVHSLNMTHQEFTQYANSKMGSPFGPLDPRSWPDSDNACVDFFRPCPFLPLCIEGLDKATSNMYKQWNRDE